MSHPRHSPLSYLSSASVGAIWLVVAFYVLYGAIGTHQSWRIICAGIGLLVPAVLLAVTATRWRKLRRQQAPR